MFLSNFCGRPDLCVTCCLSPSGLKGGAEHAHLCGASGSWKEAGLGERGKAQGPVEGELRHGARGENCPPHPRARLGVPSPPGRRARPAGFVAPPTLGSSGLEEAPGYGRTWAGHFFAEREGRERPPRALSAASPDPTEGRTALASILDPAW